jgi:eukaryotic-like serine/threonine-protein kinase
MGLLEQAIGALEIKKPSTQQSRPQSADRSPANEVRARQLRGDLDAVALKALDKEPLKRYQSAAAFAEDIERYLARKPIQALQARITDRLYKFALRNKAALAAAAMALAVIIESGCMYRSQRPASSFSPFDCRAARDGFRYQRPQRRSCRSRDRPIECGVAGGTIE